MSQRPPIQLLDAQLQAAGLQGVPEWYIRALRDPSVTLVNGRPKEEFLPFSDQSMEYPIQQQWLNSGNQPPARPAPRRTAPARRADPFMDMQMPRVAVETPEVPMPRRPVSMDDLLSPEEIAANPIYDDPDTGTRLDAGLYANLPGEPNDPDRRTRQDAGLYANLPDRSEGADAPAPGSPTMEDIERMYRNRMSLPPSMRASVEREHARMRQRSSAAWTGTPAVGLDPNDAAAVDIPGDPETGLRQDAGLYANLPPIEDQEAAAAAQQPAGPTAAEREEAIARRQREILRMTRPLVYPGAATSPEAARAQAEAEYDNPRDPNSSETWNPQVRSAVRGQLDIEAAQRAEATRASLGGGSPRFNSVDFRRQMAEEEAAKEASARKKWSDWTTSGSLDRMAQYAPEEFDARWNAAADERRKENERMRTDKEYRQKQIAREEGYMAETRPQANRALVRQLEQMGIDSKQFGDWRSDGFARESALDAKNRAMASGKLGGRYGEVQKRAMLRQNPMAYLGRNDITEEQKRAVQFQLAGGRGASPLDVDAANFVNAMKIFANQNIGKLAGLGGAAEQAQAAAAMQELERRQSEARAPDEDVLGEKYARTGWLGYDEFTVAEQQQMYNDLIQRGYKPAQAQAAVDRQAQKRRATERATWGSEK